MKPMDLDAELQRLSEDAGTPCNLAELTLHLARDEYPDLDVEAYLSELAAMAHEAEAYVRGDLPARVHGLCRYLFHEMGFRGNARNYYDPRNSYFNQVIDRRKGIPITLALLAMTIGKEVGLRVEGIGLPGHFVARAVDNGDAILFDPFHGGRQLSPEMCEQLVARVTGVPFQATEASLASLPAGAFALRMLMNLKAVYLRDSDFARAARVIERIRQLRPDDIHERRDLGVTLFNAGQAGRAIDHLGAYLAVHGEGADAETILEMLSKAKAAVAKWN
jgi:regulator of sirC expression with transglutaminase-like and TPR domain